MGYTFLFLLAIASVRTQAITFTALLVGFWAAFVLFPLPGPGFDYPGVGVAADWPHLYSGFLAHFNKNSNLSWAFDVWFLNLFPRESPFRFNPGGWSTLRIWPSSDALDSGGLVILILAGFYAVMEMKGWKRWAFPLLVIGANSIAI